MEWLLYLILVVVVLKLADRCEISIPSIGRELLTTIPELTASSAGVVDEQMELPLTVTIPRAVSVDTNRKEVES